MFFCLSEDSNVKPHILLKLRNVISQLDARLNTNKLWNENSEPDTCGEEFMGSTYGWPFFEKGFNTSASCDPSLKKPIHELVTVVIISCDVENLLAEILKTYPDISVVFGTNLAEDEISSLEKKFQKSVGFKMEQCGSLIEGKSWNILLKDVKTPYVLIGSNISYFNYYSRLERQVNIISSSTKIGAVGGAFRNQDGYWEHGCFQTSIRNYFLRYTRGYLYSDNDCMYCDYIAGPALVKTKILREIPINDKFIGSVAFADWFLRLKENYYLAMMCPDVMHFVNKDQNSSLSMTSETDDRKLWLNFATDWKICKIQIAPHVMYSFTCKELKISCEPRSWVKSYLLPSCCLEQLANAFSAFNSLAMQGNASYEIDSGLLIGAVKFGSFLPWDIDGDIIYMVRDFDYFYGQRDSEILKNKHVSIKNFHKKHPNKYFNMYTPDIPVDVWGRPELNVKFLPQEMKNKPTRINVQGVWMQCPTNPGFFVRNTYGSGLLRHSQWWGFLNIKPADYHKNSSAQWLPCPQATRHNCLHHYPVDGNLPFQ